MQARYLLILVVMNSFLIGGCAPSLPQPQIRLTSPANGAVIIWSDGAPPVHIVFSVAAIPPANDPACRSITLQVEASDNGRGIQEFQMGAPDSFPTLSCDPAAPSPEQTTFWTWVPQSLGLHTLSAHIVLASNSSNLPSLQYDTNSVTVCVVGDPLHPPQNIPVGRTSADCNPPVPPTFTPVPTATATPVTPIPVQRNPNQHGTGCSQYTSQNSCNLAGCSWNPQSSTCSVNP